MFTLITSIQHSTESPIQSEFRQEKEKKKFHADLKGRN